MNKDDWISVQDKLPNDKQMVLVSIPDDVLDQVNHVAEFSENEYSGNHVWQTINGSNPAYTLYANILGVTHWQPLPSPPNNNP